tara:strand:+ start:99 stop:422 length:324 start_codon:yes stop_codon:yes gene_type:complete
MASFEKSTYKDYDKYLAAKSKERKVRANRNYAYIKSLTKPCLFCGSNDNIEWHHYNPMNKSQSIKSMNTVSLNAIDKEFKKCWCLCDSCHTKLHQGIVYPLVECFSS